MRTVAEIYDELNDQKSAFQELNTYVVSTEIPGSTADTATNLGTDVTSGSRVAIWRLWLWIFAYCSWLIEKLFDRHQSNIEEIIDAERPHTLRWYAEESKKWQYGYAMTWSGSAYSYAIDDPDARIVDYAAASERNGKVILKVAKDSGGTKVPLTSLEKAAFTDFWTKWKDAGVKLEIISQQADLLKVQLKIIRDRLVLDSSNNLLRDPSVNPVANAIKAFGDGLEFDGILRLSKLVDALQAAEGVIDVKLTAAWWKPYGGSYQAVDMFIESVSGHFVIDNDNSILTYVDNVEATVFD